ncbi:hypothetical protein SISNIDRAFT_535241 [Sistotremastrum niveocremeum HHB9708]|uniref:Tat pathway signal sequence n=1 Tax=Sistotremastrum niveocremeum HHB9708 TaxID=1314777 RepID=A0A164NHJ0_9AGAM|nr:hypothetical protein SISNIDRAFT_535241 [Sistotremastrum niveocremeum HHB9708]
MKTIWRHSPASSHEHEGYRKIEDDSDSPPEAIRRHILVSGFIFMGVILNVVLLAANFYYVTLKSANQTTGIIPKPGIQTLYSPAQGSFENEIRVFSHALSRSIFYGPPTDETDQAWQALLQNGVSRIPRHQAALLPNRTEQIPGDEDHYVVALDVFHQLHCLNVIRKALSPQRYQPPNNVLIDTGDGLIAFDHVDHCVNSIRESLMCNADISVNVWQWDAKRKRSIPRLDVLHTCKNWEGIAGWAHENNLTAGLNTRIHVEGI